MPHRRLLATFFTRCASGHGIERVVDHPSIDGDYENLIRGMLCPAARGRDVKLVEKASSEEETKTKESAFS
jgi:hypothetical protein